jgi:AcrR family transcriptional regulator
MALSPNIKARRAKEKQKLKNKILSIAEKIAAKEGWGSVTIRRIASEIKYSLPVIYSHYKDKLEIILLVAERGFSILLERLESVDTNHYQSNSDKIKAYLDVYLKFAIEYPAYYQAMYGIDGVDSFRAGQIHNAQRLHDFLLEKLVGYNGEGDASKYHVNLEILWSALHGIASLHYLNHLSTKDEDIQNRLDSLVKYIETTKIN